MLAFFIKPLLTLNFKVMKRYFIITLTVISLLIYSCAGEGSYSKDDLLSNYSPEAISESFTEAEEILENQKDIDIPARSLNNIERKLIKEGNITFQSDNCKKTRALILHVANNLNGYLAKDDEYSSDYRIEHNIIVRVPSDNFDKLLVNISASIKEIDNQNISVKDVTEEYVDVEARLKAKKTVEKRYLELLSKAYSVGDVLQVEDELARLREQIESTEGRLRYLKDQVSLSTLNITFYQTIDVAETNFEFIEKLGNGFSNGFKGLLWFFIGLINVWPLLLFIGLSIWLVVRLVKKSSKKKK
ncbi:MAG: hypothetical protein COA97_01950 [Flavobacteriales bacterium]|nr:MAG: hypothetical protein COA97_01950 [Flavobacteriales bacterium]